jgi:multisubunit Na+/H+ antiporter MnhC subunit
MEKLLNNKKAQTGGLVTGLVLGIVGLIIGVIIALVIVSTLSNANLMTGGRIAETTYNETAYLNSTHTYTLDNADPISATGYAVVSIYNQTRLNSSHGGHIITAGNYTVGTNGVITGVGGEYNNASYTYTWTRISNEEIAADHMKTNFTKGIDNVSSKLPTALLIAAIVLILAILGVLVGVWQKMRAGSGSI